MVLSIKRGAVGRVNASRLYAFNKALKKDALRERTYWEVSKDSHPVNRWSYRRWQRQQEKANLFDHKFSQIPVDQQFKVRRLLTVANLSRLAPLLIIAYFFMCYVRHKLYGITPIEGSASTLRCLQNLPRPPTT